MYFFDLIYFLRLKILFYTWLFKLHLIMKRHSCDKHYDYTKNTTPLHKNWLLLFNIAFRCYALHIRSACPTVPNNIQPMCENVLNIEQFPIFFKNILEICKHNLKIQINLRTRQISLCFFSISFLHLYNVLEIQTGLGKKYRNLNSPTCLHKDNQFYRIHLFIYFFFFRPLQMK